MPGSGWCFHACGEHTPTPDRVSHGNCTIGSGTRLAAPSRPPHSGGVHSPPRIDQRSRERPLAPRPGEEGSTRRESAGPSNTATTLVGIGFAGDRRCPRGDPGFRWPSRCWTRRNSPEGFVPDPRSSPSTRRSAWTTGFRRSSTSWLTLGDGSSSPAPAWISGESPQAPWGSSWRAPISRFPSAGLDLWRTRGSRPGRRCSGATHRSSPPLR